MLLETVAARSAKAWATPATGVDLRLFDIVPLAAEPTPDSLPGTHKAASETTGGVAFNRLRILPYCGGPPGSVWTMVVYGWEATVDHDPDVEVWVPTPLLVAQCVAGDVPGPPRPPAGSPADRAVLPTENFADQIVPSAGGLGAGSYAGDVRQWPGMKAAAVVTLDLQGSLRFTFDFAADAGNPFITMNALFRRA